MAAFASTAASIRISISSGSLCPPAAKSLMPLSGIGLCEAESITPEVGLGLGGEERHRRGGQHADPHHVGAGAGQPGDHGRLQHLAAGPGVPADHGERRMAAVRLGERVRGGHRDRQRQLRGEIRVRPPAYAVRAEQPTHTRQPPMARSPGGKAERPGRLPFEGGGPGRPSEVQRAVEISASSTAEPYGPS